MSDSCCGDFESSPVDPSGGSAAESCCEVHPQTVCGPVKCPACGLLGKPVKRVTLGALVKPELRSTMPVQDEFCFCRAPACDVVYFSVNKILFRKQDLSVPVGIKEPTKLDVPVCYCFGWTPEKIRAEVESTGGSTVIEKIKAQVKIGNCYCEITNPQGSCCLGNVSKAVKEGFAVLGKERSL